MEGNVSIQLKARLEAQFPGHLFLWSYIEFITDNKICHLIYDSVPRFYIIN